MTGLPSRFGLTVNGKFQLTSGIENASDGIWFYAIFDKFRIYLSDFGGNFRTYLQKPVSTLLANKTLILGNMANGVEKYVPNTSVDSVDIGYIDGTRKNLSIMINFSVKEDDNSVRKDVIFI